MNEDLRVKFFMSYKKHKTASFYILCLKIRTKFLKFKLDKRISSFWSDKTFQQFFKNVYF